MDILKLLVANDADLNASDFQGCTALHRSIEHGQLITPFI